MWRLQAQLIFFVNHRQFSYLDQPHGTKENLIWRDTPFKVWNEKKFIEVIIEGTGTYSVLFFRIKKTKAPTSTVYKK